MKKQNAEPTTKIKTYLDMIAPSVIKFNTDHFICGKGPLEGYLRGLSKSLDLENQVILTGYRRDVADIYKTADVFAFPSKREGLGMAALEAMASGLPIITSNIHGILDYSIDGVTGYTCNPTDADGFALSITKLIANSELRKEMGSFNKQEVKKYDISIVLDRMRKLYTDIKGKS